MGSIGVPWTSKLLVTAPCWLGERSEDGRSKQAGLSGRLITREDESKYCSDRYAEGSSTESEKLKRELSYLNLFQKFTAAADVGDVARELSSCAVAGSSFPCMVL